MPDTVLANTPHLDILQTRTLTSSRSLDAWPHISQLVGGAVSNARDHAINPSGLSHVTFLGQRVREMCEAILHHGKYLNEDLGATSC